MYYDVLQRNFVRFIEYYYETLLKFVRFTNFEAMTKEDNTKKEQLTKNSIKQVPVDLNFYIAKMLYNPSYIENFA